MFFIKSATLLRRKNIQLDEMEKGVWFEPIRTFLRKCDGEWAQENKNRARHRVINCEVTQDAM